MGRFLRFPRVLRGSCDGFLADIHDIHHVLDTTMNSISMLFNGYLLYLIKNHSVFQVQTYQLLLAVDAGLDFLLALMVFVSQPVGSFPCSEDKSGPPPWRDEPTNATLFMLHDWRTFCEGRQRRRLSSDDGVIHRPL